MSVWSMQASARTRAHGNKVSCYTQSCSTVSSSRRNRTIQPHCRLVCGVALCATLLHPSLQLLVLGVAVVCPAVTKEAVYLAQGGALCHREEPPLLVRAAVEVTRSKPCWVE